MTTDPDLGPAPTARVIFRRWVESDADAFVDMYARPEVYRYLGSTPNPVADFDEARERVARWSSRAEPGRGLWAVMRSGGPGTPIGTVLLVPLARTDERASDTHEIGWHFHPDAWGHGYATEAARQVVDLARATDLAEVRAVVHDGNTASVRVCERLGMQPQGLTREWYGVELLEFVLAL